MEKTTIKETEFPGFLWIDIAHPEKEKLGEIAKQYGLDLFQIRDSLERGHLPKIEKQGGHHFVILRACTSMPGQWATGINELSNKMAFFYHPERLITVHRSAFNFMEEIPSTIQTSAGLMLLLFRKMIETYHTPAEWLGTKCDEIEKEIFIKSGKGVSLNELYYLKNQSRISKKLLQISLETIRQIEIPNELNSDLQDIRESVQDLILKLEEVSDNATHLLSTFLSVSARNNNEAMKMLTIFSAFFLPLSFVAGIYGMNFHFMPELNWNFGYFLILGVMGMIVLVIFKWFRGKGIL